MMQNRIDELRSLIRKEPGSRRFFQLGDLLRKVGSLREAAEVLGNGLQHHPRYTAAWISLGRVQLKLGHYPDAEKSFARALELDPENSVSARLLGDTAAAAGDLVRAIKAYKLARALGDPELDERIDEVQALISSAEEDAPIEVEPEVLEESDVFETGSGRDLPEIEDEGDAVFDQETPPTAQPATVVSPRPRTVVFVADEDPFGLGGDASPAGAAGDDVFGMVEDVLPPAVSEEPFGDVFGAVEAAAVAREEPAPPVAAAVEPEPEVEEVPEMVSAAAAEEAVFPAESDLETPVPTLTLARLALQQDDRAMAESIVRTLLLKDPGNDDARQLLAEISAPEAVAPEEAESPYEVGEVEPEHPEEIEEAQDETAASSPVEQAPEALEEAVVTPVTGVEDLVPGSELIRMKIEKLGAWADGLRRVSERAG